MFVRLLQLPSHISPTHCANEDIAKAMAAHRATLAAEAEAARAAAAARAATLKGAYWAAGTGYVAQVLASPLWKRAVF
jgi:hypothetical protein